MPNEAKIPKHLRNHPAFAKYVKENKLAKQEKVQVSDEVEEEVVEEEVTEPEVPEQEATEEEVEAPEQETEDYEDDEQKAYEDMTWPELRKLVPNDVEADLPDLRKETLIAYLREQDGLD